MNKKISLLLVTLFLNAMLVSDLHVAFHGFEDHTHDGRICAIHLYSELSRQTIKGASIDLPDINESRALFIQASGLHICYDVSVCFGQRAPPSYPLI